MAQVTVRVEYRVQYERRPDAVLTADMAVEDDPSDIVLRARVRASFWPDVACNLDGNVTACIVLRVMRPGEFS